jgi:uroporphyrinogen-III synthase
MENKIQILSTKKISDALVSEAAASNICIDFVSFIETKELIAPETEERILQLSSQKVTVIFTSSNAVNAVGKRLASKPSWKIYCIEPATKNSVADFFGSSSIYGSGINADKLADKIIADKPDEDVIFYCGNKRRDVLKEKLEKEGIHLEEIIVYKTIETPRPVSKNYDGILFFSPSAVNSFFSENKMNQSQLFAIGSTTAEAAKSFTQRSVIVSERPSAESLINSTIAYFNTNKVY